MQVQAVSASSGSNHSSDEAQLRVTATADGLGLEFSALSLKDEDEGGDGEMVALPQLFVVQRGTEVDVKTAVVAASGEEFGSQSLDAAAVAEEDGDDPWVTVGGLQTVIQEVVGCVKQARGSMFMGSWIIV